MVRSLGKVSSAAATAATIGMQHGEAMLRQHFIKEEAVAAPAVLDRHGPGAAVGIENERDAGRLCLALWQKQGSVQGRSVAGLHFQLHGSAQMVGLERARGPEHVALSIDAAETHCARMHLIGPVIDKGSAS